MTDSGRGSENDEIYLDYAATTPVAEEVLSAMLPYFSAEFGNPASVHRPGQRARRALEDARERFAAAVNAQPRQVVFTSGATEAANQAVFGSMSGAAGGLIVGATEHPAVLSAAKRLAAAGRDVLYLAPNRSGEIALESLEEALAAQSQRGGTTLVALMLMNNETGVMLDAPAASALAHEHGALLLCDAVQALGTEPVSLASTGADMVVLSAHKIYGPKGAGALLLGTDSAPEPLLAGGEQERGQRPGTHNLPGIVGFARAAELAEERREAERARLAVLQASFEAAALALPGVSLNGATARRGVKHSNLSVTGVEGETMLMLLDAAGVCVSAGSACAAGSIEPSHVLRAMGLSRAEARSSVRFSFGRGVDGVSVAEAATRFRAVVERCRQPRPA